MKEKLTEILAKRLGVDPSSIDQDADVMTDLGFDSLECAEILCEIEDDFGVEISDEYAPELRNVRAMADYIDEKTK